MNEAEDVGIRSIIQDATLDSLYTQWPWNWPECRLGELWKALMPGHGYIPMVASEALPPIGYSELFEPYLASQELANHLIENDQALHQFVVQC